MVAGQYPEEMLKSLGQGVYDVNRRSLVANSVCASLGDNSVLRKILHGRTQRHTVRQLLLLSTPVLSKFASKATRIHSSKHPNSVGVCSVSPVAQGFINRGSRLNAHSVAGIDYIAIIIAITCSLSYPSAANQLW